MTTENKIGIGVLLLIGIGLYMKFGRIGAVVAKAAEEGGGGGGSFGGGSGPGSSAHVIQTVPVMVADVSPVLSPRPIASAGSIAFKPSLGGSITPTTPTTPTTSTIGSVRPTPVVKPKIGTSLPVGVKLGADGYYWQSHYTA